MKMILAIAMACSLLCCNSLTAIGAADQIVDSATGLSFPRVVSFSADGQHYDLHATGVATRKKFVVKVYSVAHYLQDAGALQGADKFQAILDSDQAKQLTLQFDRSLTAQQIQDGYRESFHKEMSPQELAQLQPQIDQYLSAFSNGVQKGDEQILRWLPGGRIELILGGQTVVSITNAQFARSLWSIWFGPHSVVDRQALTSLL